MRVFTFALLLLCLVICSKAAFQHILIVVLENQDASAVVANPDFANLATKGTPISLLVIAYPCKGVLYTNFFAEVHPSQPNYIALISGSTYFVVNDDIAVWLLLLVLQTLHLSAEHFR